MKKQRTKNRIIKQGTLYRDVLVRKKSVRVKTPFSRKKIKTNYAKSAAKIRKFESLPFNNKINFSPSQKRHITARWKIIKYYQNVAKGPKIGASFKQTNAIISRERVVLKRGRGFRRTVGNRYVLDSKGYRREYTIFLSQREIDSIFLAISPFEEFRQIVLRRKPRGFLKRWANGEISDEEVHYSWVYGAYPGGKMDEGSFDRYTKQHLEKADQRHKISAMRIIYHIGGFDDYRN